MAWPAMRFMRSSTAANNGSPNPLGARRREALGGDRRRGDLVDACPGPRRPRETARLRPGGADRRVAAAASRPAARRRCFARAVRRSPNSTSTGADARENVRGAFALDARRGAHVRRPWVLLVDDVIDDRRHPGGLRGSRSRPPAPSGSQRSPSLGSVDRTSGTPRALYSRPRPDSPEVRMRTIVKGKNVEVPDRVRELHRAQAPSPRAAARRPDRRDRRVLERDASQRRGRPHRGGHAGHRRSDAAQPRGRWQLPGRPRRRRRQGRASGRRLQGEAAPSARPEEEKRILRDIADGTADPGHERRIVKTKRFAIEPMFEEDAVAAMEELGHQFFVFVNAETEQVAILYARNDGDLGMIEPIVGGEYTTRARQERRPAALTAGCCPTVDGSARTCRSRGGWSRPSTGRIAIGASAIQIFADNPTAWRRRRAPSPELATFRERTRRAATSGPSRSTRRTSSTCPDRTT